MISLTSSLVTWKVYSLWDVKVKYYFTYMVLGVYKYIIYNLSDVSILSWAHSNVNQRLKCIESILDSE